MSISDQITRLNNAKAAIKQAISNKGVEVSDEAKLDEYPALIDSIEVGGGTDDFLAIRTQNGTNMSHLFYCYQGSNLDLSGWDTSNVNNMHRMFADCGNLERLDLSNFDMSNVSTGVEPLLMFNGCDKLHTLRLDNCSNDTINKIIDNDAGLPRGEVEIDGEWQKRKMYVNPNNIEGLTAPESWIFVDKDTGEKIEAPEPEIYVPGYYQMRDITEATTMVNNTHTDLSNMFYGCTELTTINNIELWDTSNVTDMNSMFFYCRSLETLDLSSFTLNSAMSIVNMFSDCWSLETLDIRNFDMGNVELDCTDMFNGCDNLCELRLDNCDYNTIDGIISELPTNAIEEDEQIARKIYVNPDNLRDLTAPTNWVFVDSDGNEIVPDEGGEEIPVCEFCGEEGCDGSCRYCPECGELLEECTCESEEPEEVTAYVIATFNTTDEVQIMGEPNNYWLSSYDEGNTWESYSNTTRGNEVVYLKPEDVNSVKIYRLFEDCSYLTDATFIGFSNASIYPYADNMFNGCVSLESLDLNSLNLDGFNVDMMFNGCDNLRELHLEDCNHETIETIINDANLPIGYIDGEARRMYVNPDNLGDLEAPEDWIFVDSDGNEIGVEPGDVCEYCGEEGCDGSCTYCPECGNLNEECTCTCPDCGELLRECICGLEEEPPVCEFCGEEGCDGSCQEGGEEE